MKTVVQGSLITTFRCNAKCNMCNIWQHQTKPEEEIDYHYYEKLPAGLRINITGGESTIRKDIRSEERRVGKECRSRWSPYH